MTHEHFGLHLGLCACVCVCQCVCVRVCVCACACACVYIYVYMCTYMYYSWICTQIYVPNMCSKYMILCAAPGVSGTCVGLPDTESGRQNGPTLSRCLCRSKRTEFRLFSAFLEMHKLYANSPVTIINRV